MTNYSDSEDILTDQGKNERVTEFKYLGQTTHIKDTAKEEIYARIRADWSCLEKNQKLLQLQTTSHITQKTSNGPVCLAIMTYGCQTWSLNKELAKKLITAQRAMEMKMKM